MRPPGMLHVRPMSHAILGASVLSLLDTGKHTERSEQEAPHESFKQLSGAIQDPTTDQPCFVEINIDRATYAIILCHQSCRGSETRTTYRPSIVLKTRMPREPAPNAGCTLPSGSSTCASKY